MKNPIKSPKKKKGANLWSCVQRGAYGGIFTKGEYSHACRLQASPCALRGECELDSRPEVVGTKISNKVSESKAKCAR